MEIWVSSPTSPTLSLILCCLFLSLIALFHNVPCAHAQQPYINKLHNNCSNNASQTLGFACNGPQTSCTAYLIFRSQPPDYSSAVSIAYLLGADARQIAEINGITDIQQISKDTQIIVPVNCSCSSGFYQHNANYTLKTTGETYFIIANDTYESLTTCQAMINQNPYDSLNLTAGLDFKVPLRCACPTSNQTREGIKYLLTYPLARGDDPSNLASRFQVDEQSVLEANELSQADTIFFFTPFLIPLKTQPTTAFTVNPPSQPPTANSPFPTTTPAEQKTGSNKKWAFVGIGIGAGVCLLAAIGFLVWFLLHRRRRRQEVKREPIQGGRIISKEEYVSENEDLSGLKSASVFSKGIHEVVESLAVYWFEELQRATGFFSSDHIIKGSVYRGVINGDDAAIKRMKGDVSNEINILKQISHSNVIRLSGFCLHEGNTYLVYEFAEKGSLSDWLHEKKHQSSTALNWKQRVQIAYDIADGLNYLHNYANPPYIHKDLKSSNILLDSNFRAKVANFGLARSLDAGEEGVQMTRHVMGTQGYMAPEYLEHGLVTPKLDVFAFGVVMLELLSGREAATATVDEEKGGDLLLSASIKPVLEGENVRGKLKDFIDPCLGKEYPFDLAFTMAQLAMRCVAHDLNSRPTMAEVFISLSKVLSSSLDWDPSSNAANSGSFSLSQ